MRGKDVARELGLYSRGLTVDAKNALGLLVALLMVSVGLSLTLAALNLNDLEKVAGQITKVGTKAPWFLYYLLSARVVAEEVFFRGFLAKKFGILPSSLAFAFAHASYGSVSEVIGALVLGGLLAWVYKANQNIVPNIFAHVAYNLVILKFLFWV